MRFGENAYKVIQRTKAKLEELKAGLPAGVDIRTEYDRSALIERSVDTLKQKLLEEITVVALIIIIFLLHFRSSLVAIFVLPTGVLASLILMNLIGLNANIMSLGGIALAIGVMVDSAVIMIENVHKHLEQGAQDRSHAELIDRGFQGSRAAAVLLAAGHHGEFPADLQPGRAVRPPVQTTGFTKTFAIGAASVLSITVIPVLMYYFIRGRVPHEQRNPVSRVLMLAL